MSPELLLKQFDRISEAPDAIPRLRRFILDLAVRGKLVEQDPNDEPAVELLKRIQVEKARLEQQLITGIDTPFQAPTKWVWSILDKVSDLITDGEHLSPNKTQSGMLLLTAKHILDGGVTLDNPQYVAYEDGLKFRKRCAPQIGDLLICSRGTIGRCCVMKLDAVFCLMGSVILVRPLADIVSQYLDYFLKSEIGQLFIRGVTKGMAVSALYLKDIRQCPIPLPPLAEQHRIVAKVDELMALCDQLEAARNERETRRDRLLASSLNRIGISAVDAANNAASFHLNHLPRLTTRPEHIKQLRQTILNLAVRGRLVPQDPQDEPASELLKQIQTEKAKLEKEGEIKKEKPIKAVTADEVLFDIPSHWNWVRLGELTELITKGSSPKWQGISYSSKEDGVLFVTSENVGNYCLRKIDEPKYVEKRFNEIEPRSILRRGDILMNLVGASIGRTAVYDLPDIANINQAVALIRLVRHNANQCTTFLLHYLNSPSAIQFMSASQVVTAQPNISLTNAREFPIPLPPLAEQHCIVAKVDELMALCDQLEAQLTTTANDSRRLLEAVLRDALDTSAMVTG